MKVVGQHHDRVDHERMALPRVTERSAQQIDVIGEQPQPALREIDGEEEAAAGDGVAPIVRHRRLNVRRWVSQELNPSYTIATPGPARRAE